MLARSTRTNRQVHAVREIGQVAQHSEHRLLQRMGIFLISFVLACLCGTGARDQLLLAQMTAAGRRRETLLATALATAGATAVAAAWLGADVGTLVTAHARLVARGGVLILAGVRLLAAVRTRPLREPTDSLGAAAIVLFAFQVMDAARLSILAIALCGSWAQAASGGALGSAVALAIGWFGGSHSLAALSQVNRARQIFGVVLIVAGVWTIPGLSDRIW